MWATRMGLEQERLQQQVGPGLPGLTWRQPSFNCPWRWWGSGELSGPWRAAVGFSPCVLAGILQLGRQPLLLFCLSPPAPLPAASLTGLAALELCAHSFSPHLPHCLKTLRPLPDGWAAPSHPDQGLARALPQEPWPGLGTAPLPHVSLQTISFGYVTEGSSSPA